MEQNRMDAELRQIMTDPDSAKLLVNRARRIGQELNNKDTTTSQIRALFGEVRQIESQWQMEGDNPRGARRRLTLLKPKMAYRAQRERSVAPLVEELDAALDIVIAGDQKSQSQYFAQFIEYFEAILAYYTANRGNRARDRRE